MKPFFSFQNLFEELHYIILSSLKDNFMLVSFKTDWSPVKSLKRLSNNNARFFSFLVSNLNILSDDL